MKKRNRANRRRSNSRPFGKGIFGSRPARKRKSYSFEHLEQRLAFTATPLDPIAADGLSNDSPEGAAALLLRELQWAALQSGTSSSTGVFAMSLPGLPGDPLFPNLLNPTGLGGQWHLINYGQEVGNPHFPNHIYGVAGEDLNVIDVWQGIGFDEAYTGEGIVIAVLDSGVEMTHPDLVGNLHPLFRFNAVDGTGNVSPDIYDDFGQVISGAYHGTAVAGVIAATWDRDGNPAIGGVGVAPEATLVPILLFSDGGETSLYETLLPIGRVAAALRYAMMHDVDITNNSWGSNNPARHLSNYDIFTNNPAFDAQVVNALREAAIFGRDGLGMINVFAAGNSAGTLHTTAYDAYRNSRYVISVTGVDHDGHYLNADGTITTYPEAGPNILVAAPTGSVPGQDIAVDTGNGSGIWTTDLVGDLGNNALPDSGTGIDDDRDFLPDANYTTRFNGTSASSPMVAGVIALMLEANPNLTYRDVQEILVRSARQNAPWEIPATVLVPDGDGDGSPTAGAGAEPEFDWGDAPTEGDSGLGGTYPVLLSANGARHRIDNNTLRLGTSRDAEDNGLPAEGAQGDDADNVDDENSLTILTPLIPGQTAQIRVNAPNLGTLNAWIDWDGDGVWEETGGERITPAVTATVNGLELTTTNTDIDIDVPADVFVGTVYARFRLSSGGRLTPFGSAEDGEVEDHPIPLADFGDLPDDSVAIAGYDYPTKQKDDGPRHLAGGNDNPTLGAGRDFDIDGQPRSSALGDDISGGVDDEDGVEFSPLTPGEAVTITVTAPLLGKLDAWIDWNADGDFDDNGEQIANNLELTEVETELSDITIPDDAVTTYARFRLSTVGALDPIGPADDGEVEDYKLTFGTQPPDVDPPTGVEFVGNTYSTWQTNQFDYFRDPDPWILGRGPLGGDLFEAIDHPLADPRISRSIIFNPDDLTPGRLLYAPDDGNDFARRFGHYELIPGEFSNSAGYTISQGYGVGTELIGYGHGVIDAELAVRMAQDWHDLNQDIPAGTERSFARFTGATLLAAQKMEIGLLIPGGISPVGPEFIPHFNEYFADDPFSSSPLPQNGRGASYTNVNVPLNQQMNVEWVEIKLTASDPTIFNYLKLNLTSPNGMQSELNHYYSDASFAPNGFQDLSRPIGLGTFDPLSDGPFTFTFATNRNWGESTNAAVIIDPLTGEPVAGPGVETPTVGLDPDDPSDDTIFTTSKPILRDWELHFENYGAAPISLSGIEVVWHGKPIAGATLDQDWLNDEDADGDPTPFAIPTAQRIQGVIGIDIDNDDEFSGIINDATDTNEFNVRYIQELSSTTPSNVTDSSTLRTGDLTRRLLDDFDDANNNGLFDEGEIREQEPFAANVLVEAFRYTPGASGDPEDDVVEAQPIAQFLTGADGNYYFDLVPGNYIIKATDRNPNPAALREDVNTPDGFRRHYSKEWRITADWFFAPDRTDPVNGRPGEIIQPVGQDAPTAFRFASFPGDPNDSPPVPAAAQEPRIPMAVRDLNFLLRPATTPAEEVVVKGFVFADVNGNAAQDIFDAPANGLRVYFDSIRNGQFDPGELFVVVGAEDDPNNPGNPINDGSYELTIPASAASSSYVIGVDLEAGWAPTITGGDQILIIAPLGGTVENQNFFLNPPDDPTGSGLGNITGFVFNDLDSDGIRDNGENGISNVTIYIDTGPAGFDANDVTVTPASNGGYFLPDLPAGTYKIAIVTTGDQELTSPLPLEFHTVNLAAGETRTNVAFGVKDLAFRDFGDLPASYNANGAPSHVVVQHFRLGARIDGEVAPLEGADDNDASGGFSTDDGVHIVAADGKLRAGENVLLVQTFGAGGRLTGWIDWNNDKIFNIGGVNDERLTFIDDATGAVLGTEADLSPTGLAGIRLRVVANSNMAVGEDLAMRFRWGEVGITLGSQSFIGEVEDYIAQSTNLVAPTLDGDFNDDGGVNAADYVAFRKLFGTSIPLPNSTNPGSPPVAADETLWRSNYGAGEQIVAPSLDGDFNNDGGVGAADYVPFRKLLGTSISLPNSTNPTGPLVAADETLWRTNFGSTDSGSSPVAGQSSNPAPPANKFAPLSSAGSGSYSLSLPAYRGDGDAEESSSPIGTSSAAAPIFVGTSIDVSSTASFDSTTVEAQSDAAASDGLSDAEALLLLDQAIAELDDRDDDAPLADRKGEDDGYDDLALAAVFEDESSWWSL